MPNSRSDSNPQSLPDLNAEELSRYSRQMALPHVGVEGQKRLKAARVLIVGAGGLGSPSSLYLAAAGVGKIGLIDADSIAETNLQRQILYNTAQKGLRKVVEAKKRLEALNPNIEIKTFEATLDASNALRLISDFDMVIDGTDNLDSRYLISHACVTLGKPHLYAGIFQFEGQVAVFASTGKPCYRCLYPDRPKASDVPNCNESGVLGALAGVIGSTQALECLKLILNLPGSKPGQLFVFDSFYLESRTAFVSPRENCPHCGKDAVAFKESEVCRLEIRDEDALPPDAVLLDVRDAEELKRQSIPNAFNLPLKSLNETLSRLDANSNYLVICQSGQRSRQAQDLLFANGFKSVWNLTGGLNAQAHRWVSREQEARL